MRGFFTAIWSGLVSLGGLLMPLGHRAGSAIRSPAVRWALHLLAVALVLLLLYLLNERLGIYRLIPTAFRLVAHVWLPVLFLLVYALGWLGWWLWRLLTAEEEASYYPDIDAAWDAAVHSLATHRLGVADLPLFLVLGRPEGPEGLDRFEKARVGEEALFNQAAQLNLIVKQAPAGAQAPLHVYAGRDALYVTCAGASLLGRQAALLAGDVEAPASVDMAGQPNLGESPADATLRPGSAPVQVQKIVDMVRDIAKEGREPTEEERREIRRLERLDRPRPSLMKDNAAVADLTARLRHLCRLIVRDRRPYCPVNGVLVLVPLAATDSDADAQGTAETLAGDLQTVRATFKADCPLFAMVCDLESLPGFREFIGRQGGEDRKRRVGQRFAMGTDLRGEPLTEAVAGAVEWLCNDVLRDWVYRLFKVESPGRDDQTTAVAANARLYQMLGELRDREARLARVLTRGLVGGWDGAPRFGGCYLGATGAEAGEQAFVAGVFRRLTDGQNSVAWTPEARAEDARYRRLVSVGYSVLAGLGVLVLAVAGWSIFGPRGPR
jgi:hypothetical protein